MLQKRLSVKHDVIIDILDYLPLFLLVQLECTTYVISVVNNLKILSSCNTYMPVNIM